MFSFALRYAAFGLLAWNGLAAACPPPLSELQIAAFSDDRDDAIGYALARVLKCDWEDAAPFLERSLSLKVAADGAEDGLFAVVYALGVDPDNFIGDFSQAMADSAEPAMRALALTPGEERQARARFEAALPKLVALVRKHAPPASIDALLELALVGQDVRNHRVEDARARLERLEQDAAQREAGDVNLRDALAELHKALYPESGPVQQPSAGPWVLDRTRYRRFRCGFQAWGPSLDGASVRAAMQSASGDLDAAVATLLQDDWRSQIDGVGRHTGELVRTLHQRYGEQDLSQAWSDAEASLRIEPGFAGVTLFGQFLPMPSAVREDDPAGASGAFRERPLTREEALDLLRHSGLGQAMQRVGAAAISPEATGQR